MTEGLGAYFQLRVNAYKPHPSGVVLHPTIDNCIDIFQLPSELPDKEFFKAIGSSNKALGNLSSFFWGPVFRLKKRLYLVKGGGRP